MNRPDIAAFVLASNAAWTLTASIVLMLVMRKRGWCEHGLRVVDGLRLVSAAFALAALILFLASGRAESAQPTWEIHWQHINGNPSMPTSESAFTTLAACRERVRELNGPRVQLWSYVCERTDR